MFGWNHCRKQLAADMHEITGACSGIGRTSADRLLGACAGLLDPSNRWRCFAVAASGTSVNTQQENDLYVARLRARRASPMIYANGRKVWLRDGTNAKSRRIVNSN
jgi:hypothetical protein